MHKPLKYHRVSVAAALLLAGATARAALVAHYDFVGPQFLADKETAHEPNAAGTARSRGWEIVFQDGLADFTGEQSILWKGQGFEKVITGREAWSVFVSGRRTFPVGPARGSRTSHVLSYGHGPGLDRTTIEIGFYAHLHPKAVRVGLCTKGGKRAGKILSVKDERAPFAVAIAYRPDEGGTLFLHLNETIEKLTGIGELVEPTPASLLRLGGSYYGSGQYTGAIHELRVYDHCLSAKEYLDLHSSALDRFAALDVTAIPTEKLVAPYERPEKDGVRFSRNCRATIYCTKIARWNARRIAWYVSRAWDKELRIEVITDPGQLPEAGETICVGLLPGKLSGFDTERLGDQGYVIQTQSPNRLVIYGNTSRACFFGTTHFLEKYLGFGWFWPGRLGTVIPPDAPRVVSGVDEVRVPVFKSRKFSGVNPVSHASGAFSFLDSDLWLREAKDDFHHAFKRVFPPREFAKKHPDLYPLINGKRKVPGPNQHSSWQVCVSNPRAIEVATDKAIAFFEKHRDRDSFSLGRNDGYGDCECASCRAWDGKPLPDQPFAGLGDRYYRFMNAVIERVRKVHPCKYIGFLVYSRSGVLPQNVKPHPNLMPYFTKPTVKLAPESLKQWTDVGFENLGLYFWWYGRSTEIVPQMYVRRAQRELQRFEESVPGRLGIYAEMYPIYPLSVPKHWIICQLYWDPYQDVDELLSRFCRKFYGPGAEEMLAFWNLCMDRCEERYKGLAEKWGFEEGRFAWFKLHAQFGLYDRADYERMAELLQSAQEKAGNDGPFAERIRVTRQIVRYGSMAGLEYVLGEELVSPAIHARHTPRQIVAMASELAGLREKREAVYMDEILREPYLRSRPLGEEDTTYNGGEVKASSYPAIAAERVYEGFSMITRELGKDEAASFWQTVVMDVEAADAVREQAKVQLALIGDREPVNRARNPGFEKAEKFIGSVSVPSRTDFLRNTPEAHTGGACVRIREVSYQAFIGIQFVAKPGQRWRASVWAKTNAGRTSVARPTIVLWGDSLRPDMTGRRYVPLYLGSRMTANLPTPSAEWQEITMEFSVPDGVHHFDLRLKGFGMKQGEWVMYDDVSVTRIGD